MTSVRIHSIRTLLATSALTAAAVFAPPPAVAQRAQSRLTPLVVHPGAESLGSSLLLKSERVDLSTITREDRSLQVGRELVQGESVTTIRKQRDPVISDVQRERHQQVIREQDDLRHKRITVIYDD